MSSQTNSLRMKYSERVKYSTNAREPFYEVVIPYLPENQNAPILDIGSGDGSFVRHLGLASRYRNIYLIEGNESSADALRGAGLGEVLYLKAQARLPFNDNTIALIHCSHLIEHLSPDELYNMLMEFDRVLSPEGIMVVSTPLYVPGQFYNDLSHVKPYQAAVLTKYLCGGSRLCTRRPISTRYIVERLTHRYCRRPIGADWASPFYPVYLLLRLWSRVLSAVGIAEYLKNGYTIVLRKTSIERMD